MRRRELLVRAAAMAGVIPATLWAVSCGGDGGGADANFQNSWQKLSETGAAGHSHILTILCADLGGGDVLYTTSEAASHVHMVAMTRAELGMLQTGATVTKAITDQNHSHTWILVKPSTAC